MRPITVTVGPLAAASATNIRTAASATAGAMILDGTLVSTGTTVFNKTLIPIGAAKLDQPRQVLFTTGASEAGKTVAVTGLDWAGNAISETVALPSSATTVATVLNYAVFYQPVISANSSNTISIGTNGVATSSWVRLDGYALPNVAVQCTVSGTVNYTVQSTLDDPDSAFNPVARSSVTWVSSSDTSAVGASSNIQTNFLFMPVFVRALLNSGTGTVTMTVGQSGVVPE